MTELDSPAVSENLVGLGLVRDNSALKFLELDKRSNLVWGLHKRT